MVDNARKKMLQATVERKTHFKLYKTGRNWTIAGLTVLFSGVMLLGQPQVTHAAGETPVTTTQKAGTTQTTTQASQKATAATEAGQTAAKATTPATVATIGQQTLTAGAQPALPTVTMATGETAPTWALSDFDFSNVDAQKAGTYAVSLSASGLAKLQAANPHQTITASTVKAGSVTVQAKPQTTPAKTTTTTAQVSARTAAKATTTTASSATTTTQTTSSAVSTTQPVATTTSSAATTTQPTATTTSSAASTTQSAVTKTQQASTPTAVSHQPVRRLKKAATVHISVGSATKAYDGKDDNPATVNVTLTAGMSAPSDWFNTGSADTYQVLVASGDLDIASAGQPGTSTISLSATGLAALQAANPEDTVSAADVTSGTLTITKKLVQDASITIANQTKSYDQDPSTDPTTYAVTLPDEISAPSAWAKNADGTYALSTGADVTVANGSSQAAGTYAVTLSTAALTALQAANPTLNITAATIAPARFTIESIGDVSVGTAVVDTSATSLPETVAVTVSDSLTVPSDWSWTYHGFTSADYPVPLTADNFDLSQVQLGTAGSYTLALSDQLKAKLRALNPNVTLGDDSFDAGEVLISKKPTSTNVYGTEWLYATMADTTLITGQPYDLTLHMYVHGGNVFYDGLTEYLILPTGFNVADATGKAASDPAATLQADMEALLAPSASDGYRGVTVTRLADYHGRQTFQVTIHTDGSNQAFDMSTMQAGGLEGSFNIPIVVDDSVAGTRVQLNSSADSLDSDIVYITDDPSVTGDTYQAGSLGYGYANMASVASSLGVITAIGLTPGSLGNPTFVDIVQPTVVQAFNLVDPAGHTIGSASYQDLQGSTYVTADVVPHELTVAGVQYLLDVSQLNPSDVLTAGTDQPLDTTTLKVNADTRNIVYRQVISQGTAAATVQSTSKNNDGDASVPATYTVTLLPGMVAPSDWQATSTADAYSVAADSADLDLSVVVQAPGTYTITLSDEGLDRLAAANPAYLFGRYAIKAGALTINPALTTTYVDEKGNTLFPSQQVFVGAGKAYSATAEQIAGYVVDPAKRPTNATGTMPAADTTVTFVYEKLGNYVITAPNQTQSTKVAYVAGSAYDVAKPTTGYPAIIANYTAYGPDGVALTPVAGQSYYDFPALPTDPTQDTPITYRLNPDVYAITTTYDFPADSGYEATTVTLLDTGNTGSYTFSTAADSETNFQVPTISGYYATVTDDQGNSHVFDPQVGLTFDFDGQAHQYTVAYHDDRPSMSLDTVTKTVHYVDQDGNTIAPDFSAHANFTEVTDPVTGEKSYGPESAPLSYQANPELTGYHVVTNPAGATTTQTVHYGDADLEYTIVYNKDTPQMNLDTVTKTVHYVDQDGNTIAPDFTAHANFTEVTDPVTGEKSYGPESAPLSYQANPELTGYHVVTNPAGATTTQTVHYGDADLEYTIVYDKDTPTMSLDTVTKTVHYVDQNGNAIVPDFTAHANFTEVTDPVTGEKSYGPESATLSYQDNPELTGYHVVDNPVGATATQTVHYGDSNLEYTVVYNKNTPSMSLDTVTKTVHYVDQDGNAIAPDFTAHANFTEVTDPVTGEKSYGPESATLASQGNPELTGYHVVDSPVGATATQTVHYGDTNLEYTVVYNKNTPTMSLDTVTKTVHYVDQDGNTIAPDFTAHANFTEVTDPVTGEKSYGPESATLNYQANPELTGYHVVDNPAGATTAQTVHYGDADLEYTVVYNKNTPAMSLDTVTKTVHYVDQDGNQIAPDFTAHANFTEVTDPVTGEKSYGPESATLSYQANPELTGYHVVDNPAGATTAQTVHYGDADLEYTVVYDKDTPSMSLDTVTKTVHYVDQNGNAIVPDFTTHANFTEVTDPVTGEKSYGPESATLNYQVNPELKGYHVVTNPTGATTAQTVHYGDADLEYTVVYNKNTPSMSLDTVTKTVHYVDQDGNTIAPDFTAHANFTEVTDPVTGEKSYGPESAPLNYQANPELTGYHVVDNPAGATTAQTVHYGDADLEYTVVYNKDTPQMNLDTVTKTVHYVDQDGNQIAPDFTTHANFTEVTDPVTGEKSYGPESATVSYQANPELKGYHVVTNPAGATTAQTVHYGDADLEYTVVYDKDTPQMSLDTVTKTVHYVDQDGNPIAPDFTTHANFTEVTDPVTGEKSYGPESAILSYQDNPELTGYHVVDSPVGATATQTVHYGDTNLEYTVVYNKDTPQMNLDTVTKTVHYVDQDGNQIAPDFTTHANFTEVTDPVTGEKSYGPESATLSYQANPELTGYHVVTNPAGATTAQTVHYGDTNLEYMVVYNKNTPSMSLDTVTKTVHYVDQDGNSIAPDFTAHANFTEVTDPVTGEKSYGPESTTLSYQANPELTGYHVVDSPVGATATQTVHFGDNDLEYTVVYNKDTPQMNLNTVTKTVHYVDQDGNTIAPDFTTHANFTEVTDPVTGEKSYGPESATLSYQANPELTGYHVVTNPTGATTAQTVHFGDNDLDYTVVYNKNTPQMSLDTVTKTVHYVDQDGNQIAPDFSAHANFTEVTDPVTGEKSYGPESAVLSYQANPELTGYHVVTNPAGATATQTVHYGDADLEYTVVYNKNTPSMSLDTVTKTVHYVDQDGTTIAPDFTAHTNFTEVTDPVTGEKSYGPESATLASQDNPELTGYHVVDNPAGATTAQTVHYGDTNLEYTVVYDKDTPTMSLDTVTKTVHYVDQDGNTITPDFTVHANFTEVTDPVTGEKSYGPESATLSYQANPELTGYHVVTNPTGATTTQTVHYGDNDLEYTVVYDKDTPQMNLDTVAKTVHYVDQDGNTIAPDFTAHANFTEVTDPVTGEKSYGPESATLSYQANPELTGYHVVTNPAGATTTQTVHYGDADLEYTIVYNKDTPQMNLDTVTKTVHYVDQDGNTIAPDFTAHANFTEVTDPVTGEKSYGPESAPLSYQANPELTGYHVVTNPTGATTTQTVHYGDADLEYTVVYNRNTPQMNLDTVTKAVHYVDQDGNTLAPDFTTHANFTEVTDPVTGEKSYGPEYATLSYQDNPELTGYHVVTNPAGATTTQTVHYGDADLEYTVVYNKSTPTMLLDTVTKTVHYVDQDGNTIAPDFTAHANFTEVTDPVTGEKSYGPESAPLNYQVNPVLMGYHVVTNPTGATTAQTVHYGDADLEYTVVYNKNTPQMNLDTVTKTVHYVDQDGNQIAPDFTTHANFTEVTDPVTGEKSYGPESATLNYKTDPKLTGYHVVDSPIGATTAQTVHYGDADLEYTVVYNKNTPQMSLDTVTKTVHYVDQDGNTIAPDFIAHANFTEVTDPVTGEKSYGPESATLSYQANPELTGYHVVTNPVGATTAQTVHFGDSNLEYTVVYNKDTPTMTLHTVTKTVHFRTEDGTTLAPDVSVHANFTKIVDPVTGEASYGPTTATLAAVAIPVIPGYHVVREPAAVGTAQDVTYVSTNVAYVVVYAADRPTQPDNGGTPTQPDNGGEPTQPNNGGTPTQPDNGGEPTQPNNGGTPTQPDNGGEPTQPNNGGATTQPNDGNNPTQPTDSGAQTGQPTTTSQPRTTLPETNGESHVRGTRSRAPRPRTNVSGVRPHVTATATKQTTPARQASLPVAHTARRQLPATGDRAGSLLAVLGAGLMTILGLAEKRRKRN